MIESKEVKTQEIDSAQEIVYPCIMFSPESGLVVLFTDTHKGTVVHPSNVRNWYIGEYSETWIMERFKPLPQDRSILLTNKLNN